MTEDTAVDLSVRNGELVVVPVVEADLSLEDLANQITPQNRHSEIDTGGKVGNEVW